MNHSNPVSFCRVRLFDSQNSVACNARMPRLLLGVRSFNDELNKWLCSLSNPTMFLMRCKNMETDGSIDSRKKKLSLVIGG